jgi:hypothetical protein
MRCNRQTKIDWTTSPIASASWTPQFWMEVIQKDALLILILSPRSNRRSFLRLPHQNNAKGKESDTRDNHCLQVREITERVRERWKLIPHLQNNVAVSQTGEGPKSSVASDLWRMWPFPKNREVNYWEMERALACTQRLFQISSVAFRQVQSRWFFWKSAASNA